MSSEHSPIWRFSHPVYCRSCKSFVPYRHAHGYDATPEDETPLSPEEAETEAKNFERRYQKALKKGSFNPLDGG